MQQQQQPRRFDVRLPGAYALDGELDGPAGRLVLAVRSFQLLERSH